MRELEQQEVAQVTGGLDMDTGALAIIGLGLAGGPATGLFGLAVGGSMLYTAYRLRK